MDLTPLIPGGRQIVESYGEGRFRIAGQLYAGAVLVFPERTLAWPVTSAAEAEAFLAAHPDLYTRDASKIRLAIHDGDLLTGSLTAPGFATSVHPDWSAMSPLAQPLPKNSLENAV